MTGCVGHSDISGTYLIADRNELGCRISWIKGGYTVVWLTFDSGNVSGQSAARKVSVLPAGWYRLPLVDDDERFYEVKKSISDLTAVFRDRKTQSIVLTTFIKTSSTEASMTSGRSSTSER